MRFFYFPEMGDSELKRKESFSMVKRCFPGLPLSYELDMSSATEMTPYTIQYFDSRSDGTAGDRALLITIDGIVQILISGDSVIIVDAGSRVKSYQQASDNEVCMGLQETTHSGPKKRKVINDSISPEEDKVVTKDIPDILLNEIRPYIQGKTVRLCLVTHAHPDHMNLLEGLLMGSKVDAFIFGGLPTAYGENLATRHFLKFVHNHCVEQSETKVFVTFSNNDITQEMKSRTYLNFFEQTFLDGLEITPSDRYIVFRSLITFDDAPDEGQEDYTAETWNPSKSKVKYAKYLKADEMEVSLGCVNKRTTIEEEAVFSFSGTDEDAGCMVVVGKLVKTYIVFTGDSNVLNQAKTANILSGRSIRPDILVLSRNGEYNPCSDRSYSQRMSARTTKQSLFKWNPKVYAVPLSSNQFTPRLPLIEAIFDDIKGQEESLVLDKHEIVMFVFGDRVQCKEVNVKGAGPDSYEYRGSLEGLTDEETIDEEDGTASNSGDSPSCNLRQRYRKKTYIAPSRSLVNWCGVYNCQVKFISYENECFYRVFLETTHPVIVLNSSVEVQCLPNATKIYQAPLREPSSRSTKS